MARYYSYGRRRYGRRYYRRGYRRYGGLSLRRYRSVQMNDNETKVMTFTGVSRLGMPVTGIDETGTPPSGSVSALTWVQLFNQSQTFGAGYKSTFVPTSGRIFFAGMMFDRLRVRSVSVGIRPLSLPSSTTTGNPTMTLYAAWDRYATEDASVGAPEVTSSSIMSDPSAKSVTWTAGGSGSPLRTWIYSTNKDRYQYIPIMHNTSLVSWSPNDDSTPNVFSPKLYFTLIGQNTVSSPGVYFQLLTRVTLEFQGGYSNTTLNYPPSAGGLAAANRVLTPEEIPNGQLDEPSEYLAQQFQRMQTALPAVSRR